MLCGGLLVSELSASSHWIWYYWSRIAEGIHFTAKGERLASWLATWLYGPVPAHFSLRGTPFQTAHQLLPNLGGGGGGGGGRGVDEREGGGR